MSLNESLSLADKLCEKLFQLMFPKQSNAFHIICWVHFSGDNVIPRKRVDKESSIGAIVGGVVGGVLVILLVIAVVLIVRCKQEKKKKKGPPEPLPSVSYSVVVCMHCELVNQVNQSINQSVQVNI